MTCPWCGSALPSDRSFCSNCGQPIQNTNYPQNFPIQYHQPKVPKKSGSSAILIVAIFLFFIFAILLAGGFYFYKRFSKEAVEKLPEPPTTQQPDKKQESANILEQLGLAVEKGKAKRTMADMRAIGTALEAYAIDNDAYPVVFKTSELKTKLEPTYIRTVPLVDAWETEFQYESSSGKEYKLISAGADRAFNSATWNVQERFTDLKEDLVFEAGRFTRRWIEDPKIRMEREKEMRESSDPEKRELYTKLTKSSVEYTFIRMHDLATSLEGYSREHATYPNTADLRELTSALEPKYAESLDVFDAWDTPFRYMRHPGGKSYRLISAGADGQFDESRWTNLGASDDPNEDLIMMDGQFQKYCSLMDDVKRFEISERKKMSEKWVPYSPAPAPRDVGDSGNPMRITGEVQQPVLIHKVEPSYPEIARKARIQGVVILEAIIDTAGNVEDVKVLRALHPILDQAAISAIQQWRYEPALLAGRPVKVFFTVTVKFTLRE